MRHIALLLSLFLIALASSLQAKALRLAVIPRQDSGVYWDEIHAGMLAGKRDLAKMKIDVDVFWLPPGGAGTAADQVALVQKVSAARFDALIISPIDVVVLRPVIEAAIRAGLPVLVFDNLLSSPLTLAYVGTNNFEAGQIAGGFLGKQIGEQGSVLVVGDPDASTNVRERIKGFVDGARIFPNVFCLSSGDYADTLPGARPAVAGAMMKKYASRLNGVLTADPALLPLSLQDLQDAGLADSHIFHVVIGSSPDLVDALRDGKIQALIADNPFGIGMQALRSTVDALEGKSIAPRISVSTQIVTADKIDAPENQMALRPPVEEFLKDGKEVPQPPVVVPPPAEAPAAAATPASVPATAPAPEEKDASKEAAPEAK